MPHRLYALEIREVSLVDNPSNAETDPVTGCKIPRARIALFKRDSDSNAEGKERKMGFTEILKSCRTRAAVVEAVETRAQEIAKRDGVSLDAAAVRAWTPDAYAAYENAPKEVKKRRERQTFQATKAEAELDRRARKRMDRSRCSYAKAVSAELEADQSLYEKYEAELAAGQTYEVPVPVEYLSPNFDAPQDSSRILNKRPGARDPEDEDDEDDEDDLELHKTPDECSNCGAEVDMADKFCKQCGSNLKNKRKKRSPQTIRSL